VNMECWGLTRDLTQDERVLDLRFVDSKDYDLKAKSDRVCY
jgi:hypothetical protein